MQKIFKYTLNPDSTTVHMPVGAQILSVREQDNQICIWALVYPDHPTVARVFNVYGTGHIAHVTPTMIFLGTVMLLGGSLVFHIFEETTP